MQLWIAEKHSLALDVAGCLGPIAKKEGYMEINGGQIIMTWCDGHIFELMEPDAYTSDAVPLNVKGKKIWRFDELPIIPEVWKMQCTNKGRFSVIRKFAKEADSIVNLGDPDREGQLLIDEVLEEAGIDPDAPKVLRIMVPARDEVSVKRALAAMRPNREMRNFRLSARARSRADWLIGMNGSRGYTLSARGGLVPVGRVQTPTLAMVVRRDAEIENFQPRDYFVPIVVMQDGTELHWKSSASAKDTPFLDDKGRIIDRAFAQQIIEKIKAQCGWEVTRAESDDSKKVAPPLPHDLNSLQVYMSKHHQMSAKDTLKVAQSLYAVHKLTSYPRTDTRYLTVSMYEERRTILESLAGAFKKEVEGANDGLKSRAFNDKEVTVHYGIVPTGKEVNFGRLSKQEQQVFSVISKFYIAQYYPDARYREVNLELLFDQDHTFVAAERSLLSPGWKTVLGGVDEESPSEKHPDMKNEAKPGIG